MAEYKIVLPPPAFVSGVDTATTKAAAWLTEACAGGFEPLAVVAHGSDARMTLTGANGAALVLRKLSTEGTDR